MSELFDSLMKKLQLCDSYFLQVARKCYLLLSALLSLHSSTEIRGRGRG